MPSRCSSIKYKPSREPISFHFPESYGLTGISLYQNKADNCTYGTIRSDKAYNPIPIDRNPPNQPVPVHQQEYTELERKLPPFPTSCWKERTILPCFVEIKCTRCRPYLHTTNPSRHKTRKILHCNLHPDKSRTMRTGIKTSDSRPIVPK